MSNAELYALILRHGIPAGMAIYQHFSKVDMSDKPTAEEWDALEDMGTKTYEDYVSE